MPSAAAAASISAINFAAARLGDDAAALLCLFDLGPSASPLTRNRRTAARPGHALRRRHRHRHDAGADGQAVPGVFSGVLNHGEQVRRHGPWPRDRPEVLPDMGGDITVASEPGKGSVFTVRLPGGAPS
jgi:hypothetical protein